MSGSEKDDRIVSLAFGEYKNEKLVGLKSGLFNPGVSISQGAFWVHKISDLTIAKKPRFKDTEFYDLVKVIFSDSENIIVGHAICNDLFMIAREGIHCQCKIIDTQYCSAKLLKTEKTSLNFLSREFNLLENYESNDVKFHTAEGDIIVTSQLLKELLKYSSIDELVKMSMTPFYELTVKDEKFKKQNIFNLAKNNKEKLYKHFETTKDQKAFYALMYFYSNGTD
jgi:DNA polymerase III epsilon subunit-like protein